MAGGDLVSSPLAASFDPRVNVQSVQNQMINPEDDAFDMVGHEDDALEDEPDYTQVTDIENDDDIVPDSLEPSKKSTDVSKTQV